MQSNDSPQLDSAQAGEERGNLGTVSTVVRPPPQSAPSEIHQFIGAGLQLKFALLRRLSEDAQISKIKKRVIEFSMLRELELKVRRELPGFNKLQSDQQR